MILIDYLQKNNIPHNIYITRALYKDLNYNCDDIRNCIRIFIWARTPSGIWLYVFKFYIVLSLNVYKNKHKWVLYLVFKLEQYS